MKQNPENSSNVPTKALARVPALPRRPATTNATLVPTFETGFETPRRIGLTIAFLVFGVFGMWAAFAPIDGSAHAMGFVTVKSYKKVIQHLEGGIVSEIRVQNGDSVNAGDILLVMDPTQPLAQLEISSAQQMALTALESRLIAERDNLDAVIYPAALQLPDSKARIEMEAQDQIFRARKTAREGAQAVLGQRIEQLESRVDGLQALQASKRVLAASFDAELQDTRVLLAEGFSDKLRLRELERNHASLSGEAAELAATIAATEIQIGETRLEMLQQEYEFQNEVANMLADTQNKQKDIVERVNALTDIVARTEVRAPVAGVVNGLQFHTEGGVIPPGTPIAEIVPQGEDFVIDARVQLIDIDRVAVGQQAMIRMSAYNTQSVPTLFGTVLNVSADSHLDEATGASYYQARLELNPESLAALEGFVLLPGMPAEVFIESGSRTLLQYLMKPLTNAAARSFIED